MVGRVTPHSGRTLLDYFHSMINKKLFFKTDKVGLVLSAAFLVTLTGCVGYVDGPRAGIQVEPAVQVDAGFVAQDDYVYYPGYQMYYSSQFGTDSMIGKALRGWRGRRHEGSRLTCCMASPSVRMDFHDSPANHHAAVVKKYPKNWKPSGSNKGRKENRKDDQHDQHGENNGR